MKRTLNTHCVVAIITFMLLAAFFGFDGWSAIAKAQIVDGVGFFLLGLIFLGIAIVFLKDIFRPAGDTLREIPVRRF